MLSAITGSAVRHGWNAQVFPEHRELRIVEVPPSMNGEHEVMIRARAPKLLRNPVGIKQVLVVTA